MPETHAGAHCPQLHLHGRPEGGESHNCKGVDSSIRSAAVGGSLRAVSGPEQASSYAKPAPPCAPARHLRDVQPPLVNQLLLHIQRHAHSLQAAGHSRQELACVQGSLRLAQHPCCKHRWLAACSARMCGYSRAAEQWTRTGPSIHPARRPDGAANKNSTSFCINGLPPCAVAA